MAVVRPFPALRPASDKAEKIAALPYDVMTSNEARVLVKDNPFSFLHVDKAEIDLDPAIDLYDEKVYEKAAENLKKLETDGSMINDPSPYFYIYRLVMDGRAQIGLVACASVDDYLNNVIKKHELTRADKEADRIHHVDTCNANTGPIFLTYREDSAVDEVISYWIEKYQPVYDFISEDGVGHTVWVIDCPVCIKKLQDAFAGIDSLYIADGHHRAASAVRVGQKRRKENPDYTGEEEFNFFLAVLFPRDQLKILDYNRVVKDLAGYTKEEFFEEVSKKFTITEYTGSGNLKPSEPHTFGMYLEGKWYCLKAIDGTFDADDPTARLDVSILQQNLLGPILKIDDPRTDSRIDFVGGIRGLDELVRRAESDMHLAFAMCPTTLDDLMSIADANRLMPPKSTWFEPKLRSGLFIHKLS